MILSIAADPVPLAADAEGVVRVGGTRVTLDTLVAAFEEGASAEEIALQYPTLRLADIYATLSFYLHRRDEVEAYLAEQRRLGDEVRERLESRTDSGEIRARLLARKSASQP